MQLLKRIVYQSLALLVIISASGFDIPIHHFRAEIKKNVFLTPSKERSNKQIAKNSSPNNRSAFLSADKTNHHNKQISIRNNIQGPVEKVPLHSQSMPVLYFIQSLFNSWFSSAEDTEVKVKPFSTLWYQEPLNIIFRQFKL